MGMEYVAIHVVQLQDMLESRGSIAKADSRRVAEEYRTGLGNRRTHRSCRYEAFGPIFSSEVDRKGMGRCAERDSLSKRERATVSRITSKVFLQCPRANMIMVKEVRVMFNIHNGDADLKLIPKNDPAWSRKRGHPARQ